jgi:hypothetical protein
MVRLGWLLTGLVAVAWLVRVITWEPAIFGEFEFVFITFLAALAIILIWLVVLIASSIAAGARLRREMREES